MEPSLAVNHALAEMVTAFRTEVDAPQAKLYRRLLAGVPADVIAESADRLMVEPGRRFLPTPAEWMTTAAQVVSERRIAAARQSAALLEECPDCHGSGWREAGSGNQVERCTCHRRACALLDGMPAALALPASSEAE